MDSDLPEPRAGLGIWTEQNKGATTPCSQKASASRRGLGHRQGYLLTQAQGCQLSEFTTVPDLVEKLNF